MLWYAFRVWKVESAHGSECSSKTQGRHGRGLAWVNKPHSVFSFVLNLQVLLELLQAGGIVQFEESRLIRMAEKAELWAVLKLYINFP